MGRFAARWFEALWLNAEGDAEVVATAEMTRPLACGEQDTRRRPDRMA